ncbi:MAG: rhamnulokinase [Clostridia bacterium]|nr:rhamnulokinase [Clostridia bacterium]
MKKVLAFDFGASSGRAILGTFDNGKITLEELHRFSNDPVEVNGHFYWDILRLFFEIKQGILKCSAAGHKDIAAIGIDTWAVDFALLDADGELLANPYHYRDAKIENMDETVAELGKENIYNKTGLQFLAFNTLYQLRNLKKNKPALLDRAEHLLLIPDFFNYLLTGKMAAEYSNVSTTQILNPVSCEWEFSLTDALGIDRKIFKDIVDSGTVLGTLKPELAKELQMPEVPVICVASHDTGSAVASVPFDDPATSLYISCGTWSLMGTELKKPLINDTAMSFNFTNEGGVDRTSRFLSNIMGLWLIQESRRQWKREGLDYSFNDMENAAKQSTPFESFVNPDFAGFTPPGDMPGRIKEFCANAGIKVPETMGDVVLCIYQSLALKYRYVTESMEEMLGTKIDTIHMVGGGIKDKFLCQMTADATGRRVVAGPVEATAMGNIAVQLMALGEIKGLEGVREVIKASAETAIYTPSGDAGWDTAYATFKEKCLGK